MVFFLFSSEVLACRVRVMTTYEFLQVQQTLRDDGFTFAPPPPLEVNYIFQKNIQIFNSKKKIDYIYNVLKFVIQK